VYKVDFEFGGRPLIGYSKFHVGIGTPCTSNLSPIEHHHQPPPPTRSEAIDRNTDDTDDDDDDDYMISVSWREGDDERMAISRRLPRLAWRLLSSIIAEGNINERGMPHIIEHTLLGEIPRVLTRENLTPETEITGAACRLLCQQRRPILGKSCCKTAPSKSSATISKSCHHHNLTGVMLVVSLFS
jgi:hypothetical protein